MRRYRMPEKLSEHRSKFFNHFNYCCEVSFEALMADDENDPELIKCCEVIQKSIDDNFDYTIELYGTIPRKLEGLPDIIID